MILVNGTATEGVAATDRGFSYGDGVFRTFPVRGGRASAWRLQYLKLTQDCKALDLPCPPEPVLADEVMRASAAQEECVVKIIVTRGMGERGYEPPRVPRPMRVVMSAPPARQPPELARNGVQICVCRTRLAIQPRLAGIKHLNRLENVLARAEWSDPAVAEGLMLDMDGNVIGGTMTNLFIADASGLATPDLSNCGVSGVTRGRILAAAARNGVDCRIEALRLDRVLAARELVLVNSIVGAWPVRAVEGRSLTPGPEVTRIQSWLAQGDD